MDTIAYIVGIPSLIGLFLLTRQVWTKKFLSDKWGVLAIIVLLLAIISCIILLIGLNVALDRFWGSDY